MTTKVQSLDRAFDILELISNERRGLALSEISSNVSLPRSTTYRLLASLQGRGYIEKDPVSNLYRLGLAFIELSSSLLHNLELKTEAESCLRRLSQQLDTTVFLAVRQGREVVYYDKVEKYSDIRRYRIVGQRRPLYCTSLGKALLSGLDSQDIKELMSDVEFKCFTANTISSVNDLVTDIELVKKRGWSLDKEEDQVGMMCVGAPVFDYRHSVIAAVSASWELNKGKDLDLDKTAFLVVQTATEVSRRMGGTGIES